MSIATAIKFLFNVTIDWSISAEYEIKCFASLCTKNNIESLKLFAIAFAAFCLVNINSFPYTTNTS